MMGWQDHPGMNGDGRRINGSNVQTNAALLSSFVIFLSSLFINPANLSKLMAKDSGQTAGKRILLVDDDAEIVESLRLALESNGYSVLVARDGNQGLALSERENPDLVILDMMMPKRSGFLVLEKMRRTRETPLRVIMITANEGSRHKAYAEMLGVDDYIRKPFPMDRLIDSVQRLIG
jgi:CheY-like chemotaxis protein